MKIDPAKEPLFDSMRFCAYKLDVKEENHILVYDFQQRAGIILKVAMEPPVNDYTIFIKYPLLFVAGGADKLLMNFPQSYG